MDIRYEDCDSIGDVPIEIDTYPRLAYSSLLDLFIAAFIVSMSERRREFLIHVWVTRYIPSHSHAPVFPGRRQMLADYLFSTVRCSYLQVSLC